MNDITDAKLIKYQFEILIDRSTAEVWALMIDEINDWWPNDFRALDVDSKIELKAEMGGLLTERAKDGSSLEWYRVQMVIPGKSLYLTGYLAPDWGGPTTSMLKLEVEEREVGCALIVSDALLGNVTEISARNAQDGWRTLFGDGLKHFAEK